MKEGQETTTNSRIESWHRTLKQKLLGHERDVRADYLLCLLQSALGNFRVEYFKIRNGLMPPPLLKENKLRKERAAAVPTEHALSMCIVKSSNIPSCQYSVSIRPTAGLNKNEIEGLLQSCTCPD
ncbi:hypothetical protein FBU30_006081 [Linnemannia zychae]|nr:hypothetical protein FBU30_006081 [Linnemannia zychae]